MLAPALGALAALLSACATISPEPLSAAVAGAMQVARPERPGPLAVVYLTGDGGYDPMDRALAAELAARGVTTVVLDSATLFRTLRTPDEAADAIARAVREAQGGGERRVLLVGYSFGADVAPFAARRLPDALRRSLAGLVLVNPTGTAAFQVTLAERMGLADPGARPLAPELAAAARLIEPVVCVHSVQDACPREAPKEIRLPGDHTFDGNGAAVARAILAAAG